MMEFVWIYAYTSFNLVKMVAKATQNKHNQKL